MRLPPELDAFRIPAAPIPTPNPWAATRREEIYRRSAAELCRRRLYHFFRFGWHVTEPGTALEEWWHIEAICDHVQHVLEGWLDRKRWHPSRWNDVARNLLINAPPGVVKSRIVSVYAMAWMWLKDPTWRVLCLSVNPRVSQRDADYARMLIQSEWYQTWFEPKDKHGERWYIRDDKEATSCFANTAGGQRDSMGWMSKVVGQRADAIIVDDPNDPEEAYSEVKRKAVNTKWKNSHVNRLNDLRTSLRIAIQQRVHYDDWSGFFIRQIGARLLHLKLATEFVPEKRCTTRMPVGTDTAGKPIGWCDPRTTPGERIHPARFTDEVIAEEKRLGPFRWAAQHQQEPDDSSGSIFQKSWFRWYRVDGRGGGARPEGCTEVEAIVAPLQMDWWALSVDCSFKATEEGSRVSVQCWSGKGPDIYLRDVVTAPMGLEETVATILAMRLKWNGPDHADGIWRIFVEDKANGPAAIEQLQRQVTGVIPIEPKGGKESRAFATQPQVHSGNVYLPEGAEFLTVSIDGGEGWFPEVCRFPNGDRDDQVDAFTQLAVEMQVNHDYARTMMLSTL